MNPVYEAIYNIERKVEATYVLAAMGHEDPRIFAEFNNNVPLDVYLVITGYFYHGGEYTYEIRQGD